METYAACNHVLVSPRGETSGALDRLLADHGQRRRVALLVATYLAVPAVLAASDLIATIPSRAASLIAAHAEIAILPLPVSFSATISIAWHRRTAGEPAQVWFRTLLTDAARQ
jgi:DNA-binding transcriptional LysR family regulator